jgi:hypothetical protein
MNELYKPNPHRPDTIEWHEDNLKKLHFILKKHQEDIRNFQHHVNCLITDIAFYSNQIDEAKKLNKKSFIATVFKVENYERPDK